MSEERSINARKICMLFSVSGLLVRICDVTSDEGGTYIKGSNFLADCLTFSLNINDFLPCEDRKVVRSRVSVVGFLSAFVSS